LRQPFVADGLHVTRGRTDADVARFEDVPEPGRDDRLDLVFDDTGATGRFEPQPGRARGVAFPPERAQAQRRAERAEAQRVGADVRSLVLFIGDAAGVEACPEAELWGQRMVDT